MKIMTMSSETTSSLNPEFKQGHVWVAPVWNYTEQKFVPRPVVIVGNDSANDKIALVINFITKQPPRDDFDVEIKYWQQAGLNVKSWVRTSKPLTILKSDIKQDIVIREGINRPRGYIGKLHDHDLANVLEKCKQIF